MALESAMKSCVLFFSYGFFQSVNDYSLFFWTKNNSIVVLLVYVDDKILTGDNKNEFKNVKLSFNTKFLINNLGNLGYFLGIEVLSLDKEVCLNKWRYCLEHLHKFTLLSCK